MESDRHSVGKNKKGLSLECATPKNPVVQKSKISSSWLVLNFFQKMPIENQLIINYFVKISGVDVGFGRFLLLFI